MNGGAGSSDGSGVGSFGGAVRALVEQLVVVVSSVVVTSVKLWVAGAWTNSLRWLEVMNSRADGTG